MKNKILATVIALLLIAGSGMAQKQLYFGLAGGGLSSIITNQNNYGLPFEMDYTATFGGAGNVNIGFDFNGNLGLKLEIGFAKLGQKYEDNYKDTVYTRNVKLNYLQIPLLFKFRSNGEVIKFYAMAGPQINLLLSATQEYYKHGSIYDEPVPGEWTQPTKIGESTITDRYNSLDVMGRLDLGIDIKLLENLFINVGATMAYGFLDINATEWQMNDKTGNYNPSHNIYGGITCGINYVLPIGSK